MREHCPGRKTIGCSTVAALLFAGMVVSAGRPARALTTPCTGDASRPPGVNLPPAVVLKVPFEAGERARVVYGYGSTSTHARCNDLDYANDYHALDFELPDRPARGHGYPVLAAAPGMVVKAGWASEGWTTYGQRVLVRLDTVADGHTYHVMYAHLNAIYVAEGDHVDQGTHIGDMGCSCDGSTTCMWSDICGFGTHLHFAIHQDSIIGGSGTGGSYGGRAVVPEPLDGYEDILHNDILVSTNEPPPAADADADADAPAEDVPGSDADSDVPAGPDADADAGTDGDSDAGPDGDAANEVLPPPDADGMGDVATSDGSDVLVPPGRDDGGCGCAAAGTPAGSFVSLLAPVLAWLVFRVRRRPEGRGISHRRMTQVRTRGWDTW